MKFLNTRTMPNEVAKHKKNTNRVLSTSTMAEDGDKHKNNANESAKHKNNGRRR